MPEKNKNEFKVIFRGIRGSHPVSSLSTMKYGGNTSCVEIRVNGHLIIIDAGTGIVGLGDDLVKSDNDYIEAVVLFSHSHNDHIQGFPFFKPAFSSSTRLHMYGAKCIEKEFEEILSHSMSITFSPLALQEMAASININSFKETDVILLYPDKAYPDLISSNNINLAEIPDEAVIIENFKSYAHPKNGVLIFKISWKGHSVVYATDKESYVGGDTKLISFAKNADLLIHDAQYTFEDYISPLSSKQGFGHSTPEMAVEIAKLANIKKLALYHINPSYDDKILDNIETHTKLLFANSMIAHEGLEIDIV